MTSRNGLLQHHSIASADNFEVLEEPQSSGDPTPLRGLNLQLETRIVGEAKRLSFRPLVSPLTASTLPTVQLWTGDWLKVI